MQLRPLSPVAQRKLQRRQQALTPAARLAERSGLAARALAVSRGNPGLQDLIGLRLVYGEQVGLERAEAAVAGMEAYLRQGGLPADAEVRAFLENLALDTLLRRGRGVQRRPAAGGHAVRAAGAGVGDRGAGRERWADRRPGCGAWGCWTRTRICTIRHAQPWPHPLAAGRVEPLSTSEQAALAAASIGPLFAAWGGAAPQPRRDPVLDLQLARLALLADDPAVAAACAPGAVTALRSGPAADAFRLGQDAIELLDRHGRTVPLDLAAAGLPMLP